jgi:hypothetical protein
MAAQVDSEEVLYHLDYAEKVQYQANIIVPPLVAGTLHCTRCFPGASGKKRLYGWLALPVPY